MDLVSYALVSLDNTKSFLAITNHDYDDLLRILINQATEYIESYCGGKRFASTVHTNEEYDGNGMYELNLKHYPIITFTSLAENNATDNSDDWSTVDANEYWMDTDTGIITKTSTFTRGKFNYRATYTAGYASIPHDLQYACMTLISEIWTKRKSTGVKSESLGDHSIAFAESKETNNVIKEILSRYKEMYV